MKIGKVVRHVITITPTSNCGFVVTVGCGTFAFETKESLIAALTDFLECPDEMEKEFNKTVMIPQPMAPRLQQCEQDSEQPTTYERRTTTNPLIGG